MDEVNIVRLSRPGSGVEDDPSLAVMREGAQQLRMQAIEAEVEAFLSLHAGKVDEAGRRRVVRKVTDLSARFRPGLDRSEFAGQKYEIGRVDLQADRVYIVGSARLSAADQENRGAFALALSEGYVDRPV